VTEYRLAVYQDADGQLYIPDVAEVKGPIFGPRLLATIGWLKSMGHCSYSTIEAWMEDVLQVPVSRGYLAKLCTGTISAALADGYHELTEAIPQQEQLGSDETRRNIRTRRPRLGPSSFWIGRGGCFRPGTAATR
jgi:hypothetical protein